MKKLFWLFTLIFISCSSKHNEVENIEFMSYNWEVQTPINRNKIKFHATCELYSLINTDGTNKTYSCIYNPNKLEEYFESTVDKKIISSLLYKSNNFAKKSKGKIDYDSNIGCVKALPILRIKINYKNRNPEYYYYDSSEDNKDYSSLEELYKALQVNRIGENYIKIKKNSDLINKKDEFLKYSIKKDTSAFPKPKKVEFIPQG